MSHPAHAARKRPAPLIALIFSLLLLLPAGWHTAPAQAGERSEPSPTRPDLELAFSSPRTLADLHSTDGLFLTRAAAPAPAPVVDAADAITPTYGITVHPTTTVGSGPVGNAVLYTVQLTNTGNVTDTFGISYTSGFTATGPGLVGPLAAGTSSPVSVTVDIPVTATIGATDVLTLVVNSQTSPTQTVTTTIATTVAAVSYGVGITPTTANQTGPPGSTLSYSLHLTNTGNVTDTFALTYTSGFTATGPASAGPLRAGAVAPLTVTVNVPVTAAVGSTNTVTLVASSNREPTRTVTATLATTVTAGVYGVAVTPTTSTKVGLPGRSVTYTLSLTNTGNITDSYTISRTSIFSSTGPTLVGPVAGGAGVTLPVTVSVPITAVSGTSDALSLRVSSQAEPTRTVTATLTTVVSAGGGIHNYLPAVLQGDVGGAGPSAYPAGTVWNTPFVIQNLGTTTSTVTVDFYSIATQARVLRFDAGQIGPNTALPVRPGNIAGLASDQQYSAVISSTEPVATIANEAAQNRLMSYVAATSGSGIVNLPNVTKNYVGFNTVIYLQNVGSVNLTDVRAVFTPFGGGATITKTYSITVGAAVAIDPAAMSELPNGTQFAVTAASTTPGAALSAAVNQVAAALGTEAAYSGFAVGGSTLYAPNIVRRYAGYNSPVVIQNLGSVTATLAIDYYYGERSETLPTFAQRGLQGKLAHSFTTTVGGAAIVLPPGQSYPERAHDRPELEDGQYAMVVRSSLASVVAIVNQVDMIDNTKAMTYDAFMLGSRLISLPNIVRNYSTYQSPVVVQNIGTQPTTVTVQYYYGERAQSGPSFKDQGLQGKLAATETATIQPNSNQPFRIHNVASLAGEDGQYSAVVTSSTSDIVAMVNQVTIPSLGGSGLDGGSYEGVNQ